MNHAANPSTPHSNGGVRSTTQTIGHAPSVYSPDSQPSQNYTPTDIPTNQEENPMTTFRKLLAVLLLTLTPVAAVAASQTPASASTCTISQTSISGSTKCTSFSIGIIAQRARTYCFYFGSLSGRYAYGTYVGRNQWSLAVCPSGTENRQNPYETDIQFL